MREAALPRIYELRDNLIRDIERQKPRIGDVLEMCDAYESILALVHVALSRMIYETTCLSPLKDDGSHWCRISGEALELARSALSRVEQPQ